MKLTILVPSEEYRSYAGARIRYDRIATELLAHDITLTLENIGSFKPNTADCDVVLISKCHDARSLVAAAAVSDRGKLVGVDLFDDYFSQHDDSRLLRHRRWFNQIVRICDFALCSTQAMATVLRPYRSDLPTHVMNDPAPDFDPEVLALITASKIAEARDLRRIGLAWFGVGDNAYFPVGLADLAAYGPTLGEFGRSGMDVQLTVLTNRRALTADTLALVRQLPIPIQIREWSDTAESEILAEALVAFLPVRGQSFSKAKSLNRAVTAFAAGCQVLSAGYPLYSSLGPLIYRNPKALLDDFNRGCLRLSPDTIDLLCEKIMLLANAEAEARKLAAFLQALPRRPPQSSLPVLVHGNATIPDAHDLVRAVNGLSVASPYCSAALDFDVIFRNSSYGLKMLVSREASERLLQHSEIRFAGRQRVRGRQYLTIANKLEAGRKKGGGGTEWNFEAVPFQLAGYADMINQIEQRLADVFGQCRMLISEGSPLPFPMAW